MAVSDNLMFLTDLIHQRGLSTKELAKAADFPELWLYKSDIPIPDDQLTDIFEAAMEVFQMPDLMLRITEFQDLKVISRILEGPPPGTYYEFFERLAQNYVRVSPHLSLLVEREGDYVSFQYNSTTRTERNIHYLIEQGLAVTVRHLRMAFGHEWQPVSVSFQHQAQLDKQIYDEFFGHNIIFNHDTNGIIVESANMDEAIDYDLHNIPLNFSPKDTSRARNKPSPYDVEKTVRSFLRKETCNLDVVASYHNMSRRNLQRHLRGAGTSFQDILKAVRLDLAKKYLIYSDLNIGQISEILQYAHPLILSRLFRQEFGFTPGQYREIHSL